MQSCISSSSSNSGIAVISFDLSSIFACPRMSPALAHHMNGGLPFSVGTAQRFPVYIDYFLLMARIYSLDP